MKPERRDRKFFYGIPLPDPIDSFDRPGDRMTEDELVAAKAASIAPEPEKRPLTPVIDENGFLHGEPISEGRTPGTGDH